MNNHAFISVLIAEDNDVTRQLISSVLEAKGYKTLEARDGDEAINIINKNHVHLALVDVNMSPMGGLEFAKHLLTNGLKIPIVLVTGDESVDLLEQASHLGVAQVLQKPAAPDRILSTVERLIKRLGINPSPLGVQEVKAKYSPEELMQQTIDHARSNLENNKGGPFAAIIADQNGKVIASGENRHASRIDPIAHAEVMAIRKAAELLETSDLSNYVLYCSSYPTKIGIALIESVGILEVYYGATHEETGLQKKHAQDVVFKQIEKEKALALYKR